MSRHIDRSIDLSYVMCYLFVIIGIELYYYYYVYSYFKYINPINVIYKHTNSFMAKTHNTPKEKCINYKSGCAKIVNNVVQLLATDKQSGQE